MDSKVIIIIIIIQTKTMVFNGVSVVSLTHVNNLISQPLQRLAYSVILHAIHSYSLNPRIWWGYVE